MFAFDKLYDTRRTSCLAPVEVKSYNLIRWSTFGDLESRYFYNYAQSTLVNESPHHKASATNFRCTSNFVYCPCLDACESTLFLKDGVQNNSRRWTYFWTNLIRSCFLSSGTIEVAAFSVSHLNLVSWQLLGPPHRNCSAYAVQFDYWQLLRSSILLGVHEQSVWGWLLTALWLPWWFSFVRLIESSQNRTGGHGPISLNLSKNLDAVAALGSTMRLISRFPLRWWAFWMMMSLTASAV